MAQPQQYRNQLFMYTLRNGGRTNLSEWDEQIVDRFCEEQAINERVSFDNVKSLFHDDLHERSICTILTFYLNS